MLKTTGWFKHISDIFSGGLSNTFIVTGNIKDYAVNGYLVRSYLERKLLIESKSINTVYTYAQKVTVNDGNDCSYETLDQLFSRLKDCTLEPCAVILSYPEFLFGGNERGLSEEEKNNILALEELLSSGAFSTSNNMLFIVTESTASIPTRFLGSNSKTEVVNIPLPTEKDRLEFITERLQDDFDLKMPREHFAKNTAGLSLLNIEDIILTGIRKGGITTEMVLHRKKTLIQREYQDIIELMDASNLSLDDFAGHDLVKSYIRDAVIDPIKNDDLSIVPKGILLVGPPGTGKTYFSRCLAGEAGMSFVEFKMSKILDKYVGEAEKNLERAMGVFRALSPVGVFIDEVDQALSRGDNDSNSVSKNLFGMFLAEMSKSENRGKILWVGATNYPNKLDEAFKRAGRFDKKIPFFAPSQSDRERVFKIHLGKVKFPIARDIDYKELAEKTDGYTQAEIENIVVKALELAKRRKEPGISHKQVLLALGYMKHAENDKIKEMEDIAIAECNDLEFLPEKYQNRK